MKNKFSFQGKLMIFILIVSMISFIVLNLKFSSYKELIEKGYILILIVCTIWLNILAYKDTQNEAGLVVIKIIMYSGVVTSIVLNQLGIVEFEVAINIFTSFVVVSEIASLIREYNKKRIESFQNSSEAVKELHEKNNKITNCKLENVSITNYEIIGCSSIKSCNINKCSIVGCDIEDSIIKNSEVNKLK